MPEEQADYDTDNTQPTPGPWSVYDPHNTAPFINSGPYPSNICQLMFSPDWDEDEVWDNARLIAAAGTAASRLPDEYDPVAVMKALPVLLRIAEDTLQEMQWVIGGVPSNRTPTEDEAAIRHMLADTLNDVRKETDE